MDHRPFTVASYNAYLHEHQLMGVKCTKCGSVFLPPRPMCPRCFSWDMEWHEFQGEGRLAAFTAIAVAPTLMVEEGYGRNNPYCSGIVELAEGLKISAHILGVDAGRPETIQIGSPAHVEFIEMGPEKNKQSHLAFRVGSP